MISKPIRRGAHIVMIVAMAGAMPAGLRAQDTAPPLETAASALPARDAMASPAAPLPTLFGAAPVSPGELAATTGRENSPWMLATTTNSATVANNQVGDNSTTGSVTVADNAFQNVSGISMVNFNTGNNSSINAAMSINLQISYAQPNP